MWTSPDHRPGTSMARHRRIPAVGSASTSASARTTTTGSDMTTSSHRSEAQQAGTHAPPGQLLRAAGGSHCPAATLRLGSATRSLTIAVALRAVMYHRGRRAIRVANSSSRAREGPRMAKVEQGGRSPGRAADDPPAAYRTGRAGPHSGGVSRMDLLQPLSPGESLGPGDEGDRVAELQRCLQQLGYYQGDIDERYGDV